MKSVSVKQTFATILLGSGITQPHVDVVNYRYSQNKMAEYLALVWCKCTFLHLVTMCLTLGAGNSLSGRTFRMTAENWDPWLTISKDRSGEFVYSGIMGNILEYLQRALNFTTILVRPTDGTWGAVDDNGNWGGMVGMVKRNEVDFGLGK